MSHVHRLFVEFLLRHSMIVALVPTSVTIPKPLKPVNKYMVNLLCPELSIHTTYTIVHQKSIRILLSIFCFQI